jgi:hypothetical protein
LLEKIAEGIDKILDKIESKMDNHFFWVLGTVITLKIAIVTLFCGVILHLVKLI